MFNIETLLKKYIIVYPYNIIIMDKKDVKRWNLEGLKPLKLIPKF